MPEKKDKELTGTKKLKKVRTTGKRSKRSKKEEHPKKLKGYQGATQGQRGSGKKARTKKQRLTKGQKTKDKTLLGHTCAKRVQQVTPIPINVTGV